MKMVVFGLTISSSWGNGHATLWRGLARALIRRGWDFTFFERDVEYYAGNRDLWEIPGGRLVLYSDWDDIRSRAEREARDADAAVVTSYCPDALAATDLLAGAAGGVKAFYDLDTPVSLARLGRGESPGYIGPRGLADFDVVLSYTGGQALDALRTRLGARHTAPLYGHVDPDVHCPAPPRSEFAGDMSYLGTYAEDRQAALVRFLVEPARRQPGLRFVIGGAQYPKDFPWTENIYFVRHLPPEAHPAFYASSRLTLNITRADMAALGWCPSGRLFEAAACGTAIVSDRFAGLEAFFTPGEEILLLERTEDTLAALDLSDVELGRLGEAARARVLADHTSERRAEELEAILAGVPAGAAERVGA